MLELARDWGENVGLLFDSWHWFTGADNGDVRPYRRSGRHCQRTYQRCAGGPSGRAGGFHLGLPGETGRIDIQFVLNGLRQLGYDLAPWWFAEPFSPLLSALPTTKKKTALVKKHMDLVWNGSCLSRAVFSEKKDGQRLFMMRNQLARRISPNCVREIFYDLVSLVFGIAHGALAAAGWKKGNHSKRIPLSCSE